MGAEEETAEVTADATEVDLSGWWLVRWLMAARIVWSWRRRWSGTVGIDDCEDLRVDWKKLVLEERWYSERMFVATIATSSSRFKLIVNPAISSETFRARIQFLKEPDSLGFNGVLKQGFLRLEDSLELVTLRELQDKLSSASQIL